MSGTQRTIYLTSEASKIADGISNLSQWVQKKLIQHKIKHGGPESQTHSMKEQFRWRTLITECIRYINQTEVIAYEHNIPKQPPKLVAENWAFGFKHEINLLDLTEAQFVEKVLERIKNDKTPPCV